MQEFTKAKDIKKSIDRIAKLRELILTLDQKTMAVIRSYKNPPPIVHATMRATFLLLGNGLKETKVGIEYCFWAHYYAIYLEIRSNACHQKRFVSEVKAKGNLWFGFNAFENVMI